jgi:hypothetical protein
VIAKRSPRTRHQKPISAAQNPIEIHPKSTPKTTTMTTSSTVPPPAAARSP